MVFAQNTSKLAQNTVKMTQKNKSAQNLVYFYTKIRLVGLTPANLEGKT
jgi:hypothetical protein